jgi:hypothetical protein
MGYSPSTCPPRDFFRDLAVFKGTVRCHRVRISPGWPEVFEYEPVEDFPDANGPLIVDVGGDRIATLRYPQNVGGGPCHYLRHLEPYTRHRLIAYWLGVTPRETAWQPVEAVTIRWTDKTAYEQRLGTIIEAQRQKLHTTVERLRQRGILTGLAAPPKLVITVECDMRSCPL